MSEGTETIVKHSWDLRRDRLGNSYKEIFCHLTTNVMFSEYLACVCIK